MPKVSMSSIHRCGFCGKRLPTTAGVSLHIRNTSACRRRWELQIITSRHSARVTSIESSQLEHTPATTSTHSDSNSEFTTGYSEDVSPASEANHGLVLLSVDIVITLGHSLVL
jgi:hypothetical protein